LAKSIQKHPYKMKTYQLEINSIDLGQLLDGLRSRVESWTKTKDYMESGYASDDFFVCEECTDADEAAQIASHYQRIVDLLERQIEEQGGW
jgi:hypothetical protein